MNFGSVKAINRMNRHVEARPEVGNMVQPAERIGGIR